MSKILGSEFSFSCGGFIGMGAVDGVRPTRNLITPDRIFDVVDHSIPFGRQAISRASAAMRGLTRVLLERKLPSATLLSAHPEEWDSEGNQLLRDGCYGLVGASRDNANVRNDLVDQGDLEGTIVAKGQGGKHSPLYLVERTISPSERALEVFDGRFESLPLVMGEVNAFSANERGLAAAYIGSRTLNQALRHTILEGANRYTTPDADALYGALVFESQGPEGLHNWPDQMAVYAQRKGTFPS